MGNEITGKKVSPIVALTLKVVVVHLYQQLAGAIKVNASSAIAVGCYCTFIKAVVQSPATLGC